MNLVKSSLIIALTLFFCSCGLYRPPAAPEDFTARKVQKFNITNSDNALVLFWVAPDVDREGRELKYLEGYKILRRGPVSEVSMLKDTEYKEIAFIEDRHLQDMRLQRQAAIDSGKLTKHAKIDPAKLNFSYTDRISFAERSFVSYQVVPVSNGFDGLPSDIAQFSKTGEKSEIFMISNIPERP